MIIIIAGNVGSGKSLTAVKHAVEESKNNMILTNFKLKGIKNYKRLLKEDIILEEFEGKKKTYKINWEFWEKNRNCDIFLDEVHSLINSRQAMSKNNILMSEWISQIRKIWGNTGDHSYIDFLQAVNNENFHKHFDSVLAKSNNIYLITQKVRKIDVNFKEIAHVFIQCKKVKVGKAVVILNLCWFGDDMYSAIDYFLDGAKPKKTYFLGNKFFKYYDSYELISSGGAYL